MPQHVNNLSPAMLALRLAAAGLLGALILGSTSYLINVLWLGAAHDALDVFRPDDDPLRMPGLMVSAWVWGTLLAGGYRVFWRRSNRRAGWIEGASFGLSVTAFFTAIHSVFVFQLVRITFDLLLGDILHHAIAATLTGAVIGTLVPPRPPT